MRPTIGRVVLYRTDGRNGLVYDLPAIITVTEDSHPGNYPGGETNPLPVPVGMAVHLTVLTPGGFGTQVGMRTDPTSEDFVGATVMVPGSGTYVELGVPHHDGPPGQAPSRSWRWPERVA